MHVAFSFPSAREGDTVRPASAATEFDSYFMKQYTDVLPKSLEEITFVAVLQIIHASGIGLLRAANCASPTNMLNQMFDKQLYPPFSYTPNKDLQPNIYDILSKREVKPKIRKALSAGLNLVLVSYELKDVFNKNHNHYVQSEDDVHAILDLRPGAQTSPIDVSAQGIVLSAARPKRLTNNKAASVQTRLVLQEYRGDEKESLGLTITTQTVGSYFSTIITTDRSMGCLVQHDSIRPPVIALPAISVAESCAQITERLNQKLPN